MSMAWVVHQVLWQTQELRGRYLAVTQASVYIRQPTTAGSGVHVAGPHTGQICHYLRLLLLLWTRAHLYHSLHPNKTKQMTVTWPTQKLNACPTSRLRRRTFSPAYATPPCSVH